MGKKAKANLLRYLAAAICLAAVMAVLAVCGGITQDAGGRRFLMVAAVIYTPFFVTMLGILVYNIKKGK